MKLVLEGIPSFRPQWDAYLEYWEGEEPGLCMSMSELDDHLCDLMNAGETENLAGIFALLEQLMVEGDDEVQTAVATCLLENLINQASAGRIPAAAFVPLLGPESRRHCKAWDDFHGAVTPGL